MRTLEEFILTEKAPPGKKAEDWINSNKQNFKDRYGEDWESILYAKAWDLFGESIESVEMFVEDMAASSTTAGVAAPDSKISSIKRDKFMGHTCYEVDDDTYTKCIKGKVPFKRWAGYIEDEALRTEVKNDYYKSKKLLMRNEKTGSMIYVK